MIPRDTRNRVLTLLLALALLASHGLGAAHSHGSGQHQDPPGCRVAAASGPQDGPVHLEEGVAESGFCLICALLGNPPGCATPTSPPDPNGFPEFCGDLPDLRLARPLHLGQPGRSPPTP